MTATTSTAITIGLSIRFPSLTQQVFHDAGEAHEGHGHDGRRNQGNGHALEGLRAAALVHLAAHAGEQHHGQQEAQAGAQGVEHGLGEAGAEAGLLHQVVVDVADAHAQHRAVGGDQGQVHAQGGVQGGDVLFQDDLHQLHQGGDDQDEHDGLKVFQLQAVEHEVLDGIGDGGGQQHHEDDGHAHAGGLVQLLGHAQEGADAQELGQHVVVHQDGRHDNG